MQHLCEMSDASLPPQKKIRLSNPIETHSLKPETNGNDTAIKAYESMVFEWNDDKITLLCRGYTRNNIKMGINDISSIIFKYIKHVFKDYHINNEQYSKLSYMSDNSVICNFKINKKVKHCFSTIIFTPFISKLLQLDNNNKWLLLWKRK